MFIIKQRCANGHEHEAVFSTDHMADYFAGSGTLTFSLVADCQACGQPLIAHEVVFVIDNPERDYDVLMASPHTAPNTASA